MHKDLIMIKKIASHYKYHQSMYQIFFYTKTKKLVEDGVKNPPVENICKIITSPPPRPLQNILSNELEQHTCRLQYKCTCTLCYQPKKAKRVNKHHCQM